MAFARPVLIAAAFILLPPAAAMAPLPGAASSIGLAAASSSQSAVQAAPIRVRFRLRQPARVTLVIEDASGKRVRNLVSDTPFPAGENSVDWDGTDDLGRDREAALQGLYQIPARPVSPGRYRVRGIVHRTIHLRYEFSVYTEGNPAWETADGRGGWLANHTPPSAVLFVPANDAARSPAGPAEGGIMLVGSHVTEGGSGLAWLDLQGRKRFGQQWIGGIWTGATHLARDPGPRRVPGVYAYAGSFAQTGGKEGPKPELRLTELLLSVARTASPRDDRFGRGWDRPLLAPVAGTSLALPPDGKAAATIGQDPGYTFPDDAHTALGGLAAYNGRLVASLPRMNQLLWVDALRHRILGTTPLSAPLGVAFDSRGRLLVLSRARLLRYAVGAGPARLTAPEVVIARGLEDPQGLAVDSAGRIYVSDWGRSHQVKCFSPAGALLRSFGRPGSPHAGPYDPLHMNHPKGITVDGRGRLWVAEEDYQPKRVSVWTSDGRLWKAFYGPSEYGGGGTLDPRDRRRFYYHGMEFRLDWRTGAWRIMTVYYRPAPNDLGAPESFGLNGMPETPLYVRGRQYLTNCYTSNPTNGSPIAMLWRLENNRARPVAALGRANDWERLKRDEFRSRWPRGIDPGGEKSSKSALFVWNDINGDGRMQPNEVQMVAAAPDAANVKDAMGGVTVMPDLSFLLSRVGDRVMRFSPVSFTASGVPMYDLKRGKTLLAGAQIPVSSGGDQALLTPEGRLILTTAPRPFAPEGLGGQYWSYPSLWPGLHATPQAPLPDRPGELIGTTRLLGGYFSPRGSDAGPLFAVNGDMGPVYLFTADGLFVASLFQDARRGRSWSMPEARRGMLLDDVSTQQENFWPSITKTGDGQIYLVDGNRTSLVRVEGLEGLERLPVSWIEVTPRMLERVRQWQLGQEARRQRDDPHAPLLVALRATNPSVDGRLDDWRGANWITIERRRTRFYLKSDSAAYDVKAALAVAGDRLYAAFMTGDPQLLRNAGDPLAPFKTGGALDLMIGANPTADPDRTHPVEGDTRLLVTQVDGRPRAVLYRAVVPGTRRPVPFSSPWRTLTLDQVQDVSDQVQLAGADGNYELSVPLSLLGLTPRPGLALRGDLGVLRGNGFQTLQRVYWRNKATNVTSDVPSEAELTPPLWGPWRFIPEADLPRGGDLPAMDRPKTKSVPSVPPGSKKEPAGTTSAKSTAAK